MWERRGCDPVGGGIHVGHGTGIGVRRHIIHRNAVDLIEPVIGREPRLVSHQRPAHGLADLRFGPRDGPDPRLIDLTREICGGGSASDNKIGSESVMPFVHDPLASRRR